MLAVIPAQMKVRGVWVAGHVRRALGWPLRFEPATERKNAEAFIRP